MTQTRHVFIYHGTKETSCYNGFSVPSTMKNFNDEPPTGTGRSHGLRPIFQQSIKRAARARSRLEMKTQVAIKKYFNVATELEFDLK